MDIKEFAREEFDKFIAKNNYESFSEKQVSRFASDLIEKSKKGEIDEFETSCGAVEYSLLQKAIVVENDLTKSLVYYRESQREPIEIPDGIFKSTSNETLFKYRETPLNILKGIAGICCADKDAIEKAKALPIGTEKTYGGKVYVKTERGWRPKKKGSESRKEGIGNDDKKGSASEATSSSPKEGKKAPSSVMIDQKTFRIKDGKISASKYDTPSQINKLTKYAKEKGLEIEWEENKKTPEAQSKKLKEETKDYIWKYESALRKTISLEKELFDREEKSKDNDGKDFFTLPLDKMRKTEWYKNQLDKIKESKENFEKIKSEIPKELDKQVIELKLQNWKDNQGYFEDRVKRFKENGYDKSENLQHKLLWREANDSLKERKMYREHLDNLLKKAN